MPQSFFVKLPILGNSFQTGGLYICFRRIFYNLLNLIVCINIQLSLGAKLKFYPLFSPARVTPVWKEWAISPRIFAANFKLIPILFNKFCSKSELIPILLNKIMQQICTIFAAIYSFFAQSAE